MKNYCSKFKRFFVVSIAAVFLFTSITPQFAYASVIDNRSSIINAIEKAIPQSAGYITEYNIKDNDNIIVYIQDMHCNPGVQRNISRIISSLDEKIGVDKVILEGAPQGKVESNVLTALPERVKYSVVERLLNRGLLTGVELYSVESDRKNIYGIEEWDKYIENLFRAADLIKNKDGIIAEISPYETNIKNDIKRDLNLISELLEFDRDSNWYDNLIKAQSQYTEPIYNFSNLSNYLSIKELSNSINIKKVESELAEYTDHLKNILPYREFNDIISKVDNHSEYFKAVYAAAEANDFEGFIDEYPELYLYLSYLINSNKVNPILVYYDEQSYINKLSYKEANTSEKSDNILLFRMTSLLRSYFSLSMTESEFLYFYNNLNTYKELIALKYPSYANTIITFLNDNRYVKYYEANISRSNLFFNNLSKIASSEDTKNNINVFVSGGFHTSLVEDLKNSNISYVLITPVIFQDFPSIEIYNRLIEINSHAPQVLRNALNPIPFMLAVFPNLPQANRETYFTELIESIARASENYNTPQTLKDLIDEWAAGIEGIGTDIKDPITVSYDADIFTVNVLEQKLEFKIKDGKVDFKESTLSAPKTGKYKSILKAIKKSYDENLSPFKITIIDHIEHASVKLVNYTEYMKVSGSTYSRISKKKHDNYIFTIIKILKFFKLTEKAKEIMGAMAWNHVKASALNGLAANQITIEDENGRKIEFIIEGKISLSKEELLEMLNDAKNLPRGQASLTDLPDTIYVGVLDKSKRMFENYTGLGFIGVNEALFEIGLSETELASYTPYERERAIKHAEDLKRIIFKQGLTHEIAHELLGETTRDDLKTFENIMLMRDIRSIIDKVKDLYPRERLSGLTEIEYNETIKHRYIVPFLESTLQGSKFLKRLKNYELDIDSVINLLTGKDLSNEDIMHIEETFFTKKGIETPEKIANESKVFNSLVRDVMGPYSLRESDFIDHDKNAKRNEQVNKKILELGQKYSDILFSSQEYAEEEIEDRKEQFQENLFEGLDILYRSIPEHLFSRYFNDEVRVPQHGLSHSLDVVSYMLDILSKEKDRIREMSEKEIKMMIFGALFHDLSNILSRGRHEINSANMVEKMFTKYLESPYGENLDLDLEDIQTLKKICIGHKKVKSDLDLREEHSNYLAMLLHDADALSATLMLDRIFELNVITEDSTFFNKDLTVSERVNLIKANNYLDGDAVNDLIRQGFVRRKPSLYITAGAKAIISSAASEKALLDYFESKKSEILKLRNGMYTSKDFDLIIGIVKDVVREFSKEFPQRSKDLKDTASAFTFKTKAYILWQVIKDYVFRSNNLNYPKNMFLSDIHGGFQRMVSLFAEELNSSMTEIDAISRIKEELERSDINTIYVLGDLVDRGNEQLKVVDFIANGVASGKMKYVTGNHDLYAMMSIMGIHLPYYANYNGIPRDYTDEFGNVYDFLVEMQETDRNAAKSGMGSSIRANGFTSRDFWAKEFHDYKQWADERQDKRWKSAYEEIRDSFEEAYGYELVKKTTKRERIENPDGTFEDIVKVETKEDGKDVLNYPKGVFKDNPDLQKWWGNILGRNVETMVYTGLRATHGMSINWWAMRKEELQDLREKATTKEQKELFDKMEVLIDEVLAEQRAKVSYEYLQKQNGAPRIINAIMDGAYKSTEWQAYDSTYHKSWGGGSDGWIAQRDQEVVEEFYADFGLSETAVLTEEQTRILNARRVNQINYINDTRIRSMGRFFQENFHIYRVDEYGTYFMHSMLPIDEEGNISIGKVVDGTVTKYDENGERIKGVYYKGKHYGPKNIFKAFDRISEDVRNFDFENGNPAEIMEALIIYNSIYSDELTEIKPQNISETHRVVGFANILSRMGKGIMRLAVGHNPISRGIRNGLHPVEFSGKRDLNLILSIDDEFSEKYAKPKGKGRIVVYSGDVGIYSKAYESGAENAKILGKTHVSKDQLIASIMFDILAEPIAEVMYTVLDLFVFGIGNLHEKIVTAIGNKFSKINKKNSLLVNIVSDDHNKESYKLAALAGDNVGVLGIELKNLSVVARSEERLQKQDITVQLEDGTKLDIPVSFFHKKVSRRTPVKTRNNKVKEKSVIVDYIDIYVGNEAKNIIMDNNLNFEDIKELILHSASAEIIKQIQTKNSVFAKHIKKVDPNKKIFVRTDNWNRFNKGLTDNHRAAMSDTITMQENTLGIPNDYADDNINNDLTNSLNENLEANFAYFKYSQDVVLDNERKKMLDKKRDEYTDSIKRILAAA